MFRKINQCARVLGLVVAAGLLMAGCPCIPGTNFVYFPDAALESAVRASINKPFGCLLLSDVLKARVVDASGLGITTLEGLENCANLTELDLSNNSLKSINELTTLQNLVTLDLANNRLSRIDALAGLFLLRYLDLSGADNDIRDFTALSANALNGGIGDGAVVTLSPEWTINADGEFFGDFADDYDVLIDNGVNVIFAEPTGSGA